MTLRDRLANLDRLQQGRLFKIIATILIVVAMLAGVATYAVAVESRERDAAARQAELEKSYGLHAPPAGVTETDEQKQARESEKSAFDATQRAVNAVLAARGEWTGVGAGLAIGAALLVLVVWLGLGLTYVGLLVAGGLVAAPLWFLGYKDGARIAAGCLTLTAAFTALLQALRIAVSGPGPVTAIARNVLSEAVRMKASLLLIIVLIFVLSVLPLSLSESSPLRYRVQSFLQYGTGGAYWVIALLTLLFACSSMAYEQREKVIWQTMTKPVAAWQYIFGKWLGIVGLNATLLAVCGASIFLFTEYLRGQPALGEREAYVSADESPVTEDRRILESQILTARVARRPMPLQIDQEKFAENVKARIEQERARLGPSFVDSAEVRTRIESDLLKQVEEFNRTVRPGEAHEYVFDGLKEARDRDLPLVFRYRVDSGSNRPDVLYRVTFGFGGGGPVVQEVALGVTQTLPLLPDVVDEDGYTRVLAVNGDYLSGTVNRDAMVFPKDGMELSYSAGSFRMNFVRVVAVLWIKLAFLAMVGIFASTFLSFPVACLVSFGTFLSAESAKFLSDSLEYYTSTDREGKFDLLAATVRLVAVPVAWIFKIYAELRPTGRLVEGELLSWPDVATGAVVLAAWTFGLYAISVFIFRRRELAMYSGQ